MPLPFAEQRARLGSWRRLSRVQAFAVETTTAQVLWGDAPPGAVTVKAAGRQWEKLHPGGPGGLELDDLDPATNYEATVRARHDQATVTFRTLTPPPGQRLARVTTISDLHIGAWRHGLLRRMIDRSGHELPHATRCALAALTESVASGSDLVVLKGDLTNHGWHEQWDELDWVLSHVSTPILALPGNHDVEVVREVDAAQALTSRHHRVAAQVEVTDLPGLRVVAVDTAIAGHSAGLIGPALGDLLDVLAEADRPCLVCWHHPPQRYAVPTAYPLSIRWPAGVRAVQAMARIQPQLLLTAGHTHRNRRHLIKGVTVTEVGSTKDFPGVWAGYDVYEGGIVQTVRRTLAPEAMSWTEYTRKAAGGVWAHYAPGRLEDRCFSLTWPR